ncbi:MAG: YbaK/EbsC family protein [Gammaproteobacteria bacterium]|nr:YbaK/EbsC family protein [Gammaproteobacteria bacterium]MCP5416308.1 YbaK/EbsC family protein [Chromatiaceae bacterium]
MAISRKLQAYLKEHDVKYRLVQHTRTGSSMESAEQAHIPGGALAKGVLARAGEAYLMLVLPSDYHVDLEALSSQTGASLAMATEEELSAQFSDCERGAIPPLGFIYGIKTLWDPSTSLGADQKVYFEAGDHQQLVQVTGEQFHELMAPAERREFSHHL